MKTNKNINIYTFMKIFENEIEKINKFKNPHTMAGFDEAVDFFIHDFLPLQYDFCKDYSDFLDDYFIDSLLENRSYLNLDVDIEALLDELENAEQGEED